MAAACGEDCSMMASWEVIAIALHGFRRLYGVNANPKQMPAEWREIVAEVLRQEEEEEENDDVSDL
jgi:hypothetical protein